MCGREGGRRGGEGRGGGQGGGWGKEERQPAPCSTSSSPSTVTPTSGWPSVWERGGRGGTERAEERGGREGERRGGETVCTCSASFCPPTVSPTSGLLGRGKGGVVEGGGGEERLAVLF